MGWGYIKIGSYCRCWKNVSFSPINLQKKTEYSGSLTFGYKRVEETLPFSFSNAAASAVSTGREGFCQVAQISGNSIIATFAMNNASATDGGFMLFVEGILQDS